MANFFRTLFLVLCISLFQSRPFCFYVDFGFGASSTTSPSYLKVVSAHIFSLSCYFSLIRARPILFFHFELAEAATAFDEKLRQFSTMFSLFIFCCLLFAASRRRVQLKKKPNKTKRDATHIYKDRGRLKLIYSR